MRMRGFLRGFFLTCDALMGLVFAGIAIAFVATIAASQTMQMEALTRWAVLGGDFLRLKYIEGVAINDSAFYALTGLNVSEAPQIKNFSIRSIVAAYPPLCNCTATLCELNKSSGLGGGADVCLTQQENLSTTWRQAWVFR